MLSDRTEKARKRLEKAIARLEGLSAEGGTMAADDGNLKVENAVLQELTQSVPDRLDATISRVKGILES